MTEVAAVVPAAGSARRMGAMGDKLYLDLNGRPVLARTLQSLQAAGDLGIGRIVVAVAAGARERFQRVVRPHLAPTPAVTVVEGGATRQESVRRALAAAAPATWALVHDGARPLVPREVLARCIEAARAGRCAVAGLPVKDTLKEVDGGGRVVGTAVRERLWAVQTPQIFPLDTLAGAHQQAARDGFLGTDDAVLVERMGIDVYVVEGAEVNLKITTPHDLLVAEILLRQGAAGR
ncbi:MAG TPA: 2-C-methyl-D-erythritol 4-phosphate cytidylyltransferase [Bacillota bacterium]